MDTHPITCAQDRGENGYVFRTDEAKGQAAVITARWAGYAEDVATYRLIHQGGRWVLDGIACAGSMKFNMN